MKKSQNSKGQALIESVVALPLIILTLTGFFIISYRWVVFYYADFNLQEALICTDEHPQTQCKANLEAKLQKVIFYKSQKIPQIFLQIKRTTKKAEGHLKIDFIDLLPPFNFPLTIEQSISFPVKDKTLG